MRSIAVLVLALPWATACAIVPSAAPPVTGARIQERTGHPVRPPDQRPDGKLPSGIDLSDGVTEDEAVAVALWNNAQLAADSATLGLARANLIEAGLFRNPSLQALLPIGPKPFELTLAYPLEQFWQRPRRVAAASARSEQVAEGLVQNGLDAARDARQAHAMLVRAEARRRAAGQAAEVRRQLASMAAARLRAGDISATEAKAAEIEAAAASEQAGRFEHDLVIAQERLRFVLGLPAPAVLRCVPPDAAPLPPAIEQLRELAWSERPDLRALELGIAAAGARAKWERSRLAALGVVLSAKEVGTYGVRSGPGVSLDLPIFRTNAGAVSSADAEVEQAARQYIARRQRVDLEVSEAREMLVQAIASLADWHERILPALDDVVVRTRRAYEAGDVPYLSVLDVSRQWIDAIQREIDARAAIQQAAAELDRAVGTRVPRGTQP